MASTGRRFTSTFAVFLVLMVWVALLGALAYNRQSILDAWKLRNYTAPAAVSALAVNDTMTSKATHIFYVNAPQITDKQPFADNCPSGTEQSVVLGCYHSNQDGIFVLRVTDARLNGVEQVTAAHEMLHAAYDRLSSRQKQSVNAMLQDYYDHGLSDATVKAQIADYQQSEPHDILNEMHSLFGTEIASLPSNLEQYYKQYFNNRATITTYYQSYQGEFTSRQNLIKTYDTQLSGMKSRIDSQEKTLAGQNSLLTTQRAQLDAERKQNDIAAYNTGVASYNDAVDSYNAAANALRQLITNYNTLVQTRNSVAAETNQLTSEISNQVPTVQ